MGSMRFVLDQLPPAMRKQAEEQLAERRRRAQKRDRLGRRSPGPGKMIPVANAAVERLKLHLEAEGIAGWLVEYRFHPSRGWRFDFALPEEKLAVEIDGLTWSGGRHQRREGYTNDCEKMNEALCRGWRVLRVTPHQVRMGYAIAWIKRALNME